jgi:hypothetical protein
LSSSDLFRGSISRPARPFNSSRGVRRCLGPRDKPEDDTCARVARRRNLARHERRAMRERGNAGAKRPPSLVTFRQPFGARVRWLSVPRLRSHRQRASSPTGRSAPGLRIGTVGGCAPRAWLRSAAARRASVQSVATPAQPRVHGPGICGELHRAAGGRSQNPRCLNRAPTLPRVGRSADASQTGRGEGSMGEARRVGISSADWEHQWHPVGLHFALDLQPPRWHCLDALNLVLLLLGGRCSKSGSLI